MAPFLAHLLEIRRARLVPLSGEASGAYDVYPDPYARVVLYDRDALDPIQRPLACLYAVYRSLVVMACFDRRRGELDGRRFMLLMSMCPWPEGEASCREGGIRLQEFPFERRPMLPWRRTRRPGCTCWRTGRASSPGRSSRATAAPRTRGP